MSRQITDSSIEKKEEKGLKYPDAWMVEIVPGLFLGDVPASICPKMLEENHINAIVSVYDYLTGWGRAMSQAGIPDDRHVFIRSEDSPTLDMLVYMSDICDFIDQMASPVLRLSSSLQFCSTATVMDSILVHCQAGRSRSPAVIIAYLMRKYRITYQDALKFIRTKRKVKPSDNLVRQLHIWGEVEYNVWEDNEKTIPKAPYRAYLHDRAVRMGGTQDHNAIANARNALTAPYPIGPKFSATFGLGIRRKDEYIRNTGLTPTTLIYEPPGSINLSTTTAKYRRIGTYHRVFSRPLELAHWERALNLERTILLGGSSDYVPEIVRVEGDTTTYCHDEILAVMRAAFKNLGRRFRILAQYPSLRGGVITDLMFFQFEPNDQKVLTLLELKRPGYINTDEWTKENLGTANEHTQRLTRKIRRYAHEYDCTQYLLFDGCCLVRIEFEATGNDIVSTENINIEIAHDRGYEQRGQQIVELPSRGENYATVRAVIYSALLAGIRRHLVADIPPAIVSSPSGRVNLAWTHWSGAPIWYNDQNQRLQLEDPFGWTHTIQAYSRPDDPRRNFRYRVIYYADGVECEMIRDI